MPRAAKSDDGTTKTVNVVLSREVAEFIETRAAEDYRTTSMHMRMIAERWAKDNGFTPPNPNGAPDAGKSEDPAPPTPASPGAGKATPKG